MAEGLSKAAMKKGIADLRPIDCKFGPNAGQRKKRGLPNAGKSPTTRRKKEDAAAGCSMGEKVADAALAVVVAEEEKPAADASVDEVIYVMPKEQIDYILSWDYGKVDRFPRYDPEVDDESGFDSAEWNKACDDICQRELKFKEYQDKVREEYKIFGYVKVDPAKYSDEYEKKMAEQSKADFLELFGPDPHFDCSDSDGELPGSFQELILDASRMHNAGCCCCYYPYHRPTTDLH